jgi:hypothetical protein
MTCYSPRKEWGNNKATGFRDQHATVCLDPWDSGIVWGLPSIRYGCVTGRWHIKWEVITISEHFQPSYHWHAAASTVPQPTPPLYFTLDFVAAAFDREFRIIGCIDNAVVRVYSHLDLGKIMCARTTCSEWCDILGKHHRLLGLMDRQIFRYTPLVPMLIRG